MIGIFYNLLYFALYEFSMPSNQPAFTEVLATVAHTWSHHASVQNIQIMKQFYAEVIGLSLIAESVDRVTLGFKKNAARYFAAE